MALGNMPVAYFNQRGFCRSKSDSARRCSVGAASNPSSSQRIALARKTKYAAVAHLVERHLAKVEVASSSLVSRSRKTKHRLSVDAFCFIRRIFSSMQKHIFSMRKHKLTFSPVPASSMQKATLCPIEGFLAAFGGPGVSVPTDRGKRGQDTIWFPVPS